MKKILFLMIGAAFALQAAEPEALTKDFSYQSALYQTSMKPSGLIVNGKMGNELIFKSIGLAGKFRLPEAKENQMVSPSSVTDTASTLENFGGNRYQVVTKGKLATKTLADIGDYEQVTVFEPERIKIAYKITAKVPMLSRFRVFWNNLDMLLPPLLDRGGLMVTTDKKESTFSIPATCEKGKGIHTGKIGQVKFSLANGVFAAAAGEQSVMVIFDCRNNGADLFRVEGYALSGGQGGAVIPEGKVWEWSVTYEFTPFEE